MNTCDNHHAILADATRCPVCGEMSFPVPPLDDLWTYSRLSAYKRCPRYALHSYEQGLVEDNARETALDFGSFWNEVMATWHCTPGTWQERKNATLDFLKERALSSDLPVM